MSKPTPGPWKLETVPTSIGKCYKVGPFPGNDIHETNYACIYDDNTSGTNHEELYANARLIASAPDLLAALKSLVDFMEDGDTALSGDLDLIDGRQHKALLRRVNKAKDAIKKAES